MPSGIKEREVRIIDGGELSPQLGEVVNDLDSRMPEGSSVIVQVTSDSEDYFLRYGRLISEILKDSPVISEYFPLQERTKRIKGHKHLFVLSPNTWLAGGIDQQDPSLLKYGLFTQIKGCYNPGDVGNTLGLARRFGDLHSGLDLEKLTGRASGSVSIILERQHLEKARIVHFQTALVEDLKLLNTLVDYPLGNLRFYVARGEAFLKGYAELLKGYGIPTNLSTNNLDTK